MLFKQQLIQKDGFQSIIESSNIRTINEGYHIMSHTPKDLQQIEAAFLGMTNEVSKISKAALEKMRAVLEQELQKQYALNKQASLTAQHAPVQQTKKPRP